jgi:hypothetical protein
MERYVPAIIDEGKNKAAAFTMRKRYSHASAHTQTCTAAQCM